MVSFNYFRASLYFAGLVLLTACILSCKKKSTEDSPSPSSNNHFDRLDLTNAVGLYAKKKSAQTYLLYKVLSDGSIQKVDFYKNNEVVDYQTDRYNMHKVNAEYIALEVAYNETYLVDVSTGNAYRYYDMNSGQGLSGISAEMYFQEDHSKAIYFISNRQVCKIADMVNAPGTSISLTPVEDNVWSFIVDASGNIVYQAQDRSYNQVVKLRRATGEYQTIHSTTSSWSSNIWLGMDGVIYYALNQDLTLSNIYGLNMSDGTSFRYYTGSNNVNYNINNPQCLRIKNRNKLIAGRNCFSIDCSAEWFSEVYNSTHSPKYLLSSDINVATIQSYTCSNDYLYVVGYNTLYNQLVLKVDTDSKSVSTVFSNTDFSIHRVMLDEQSNMYGIGLRNGNGNNILGKIAADGTLKIMDEVQDYSIGYYDLLVF